MAKKKKIKQYIFAFRNKYKLMPKPAKASLWFIICSFFQRGISMITSPVFARLLPEEQYGIASTFYAWESLLTMIITLSLYKAMMNLFVKKRDKEHVLSSICGLSIVLCSVWFLIFFIFQKRIISFLGLSKTLTFCLLASVLYQAIYSNWSLYERYLYNYKKIVFLSLTSSVVLSVAAVVCVLLIGRTAESRIVPLILAHAVITIGLLLSIYRKSHSFYDGEVWKFSLSFCIVLLPHYLSEFVLQSSDKLMINYMCGPRDVALYSVAYSAGSLINLMTNAINSSFAPYQYQQIEAKNYKGLSKRANQVLLGVAIVLSLIMLFSNEIVLIFGGKKYLESAEVIIPICIGIFFNYLFQLFARAQEYFERKITVVIPSVLCALLNLVLNYVFIKKYGYQAAAYTTFACYLFFCCLHYLFYKKVCKEELDGENIYDVLGIMKISGAVIIAGITITIINKTVVVKYTIIAVGMIIAVIYKKKIKDWFLTVVKL